MSLFVMADLHLSTNDSTNKSMEVFGNRWQGYIDKIQKNWSAVVEENDTVVIPGDISWAMNLEEAKNDLIFLNSLPGKKIIGKGNHDFWWSTATKMKSFFSEHSLNTIDLLYNNAYEIENAIICGSRGWWNDETAQNTVGGTTVEYTKIISREVIRLTMSLDLGARLQEDTGKEIIVFLHFPPVFGEIQCREILDVLKKYNIKRCYYGHIHGNYYLPSKFEFEGIKFIIASSDHLNFNPLHVYSEN